MVRIPILLFVLLIIAPVGVLWYIQYRLFPHRREREDWFLVFSFRALRPDRYTDEGQSWVRRLWVAMLALPVWVLLIGLLFRVQ